MKSLYSFISILVIVGGMFSCNEAILMKYNETKSLPIKADFNGTEKTISGKIDVNTLDKLFQIPSDSRVTSFAITGLSVQVNPLSGTEADFINYNIEFSDKEHTIVTNLVNFKHQFVASGDAFSISSELNPTSLNQLKCMLGNFLLSEPNKQCNTTNEISYTVVYKATDVSGNPKLFNGSVTGYLNFQVEYRTCEEVPDGLFLDFEHCL